MGHVRIVAGHLKGRRLRVIAGVRPSGARLREALFSYWGSRVEGATFFDIFAGSGAVGLEAWSRGARKCVFFEGAGKVIAQLRKNCEIAPDGSIDIVKARIPRDLDRRVGHREVCDLAFADPPYEFKEYERLLRALEPLIRPLGELTLEHPRDAEPPGIVGLLKLEESRAYGDSALSIYHKSRGENQALQGASHGEDS